MNGNGDRVAVTIPLAAPAAAMFHEWAVENAASDGDGGSLYESFVGKMSGAALRLSLVSELTAWAYAGGAEPGEISTRSVAAAIKWVEDYAKPMAQRVYGDAAVSVADRNAALLARYIVKHGLTDVNMRDMRLAPHKRYLKPLLEKGAMEEAFEVLTGSGWLRPNPSREGDSQGQPRKDYRVNPAVHGRAK